MYIILRLKCTNVSKVLYELLVYFTGGTFGGGPTDAGPIVTNVVPGGDPSGFPTGPVMGLPGAGKV